MRRKKIIVLYHGGGRLANQLWPAISVYAYCKERGYRFQDDNFFENAMYFNIPAGSGVARFFKGLFIFLNFFSSWVATEVTKIVYGIRIGWVRKTKSDRVIYSEDLREEKKDVYYLPPTKQSQGELFTLETDDKIESIYFYGWWFRNPAGITKYRREITDFFRPRDEYVKPFAARLAEERKKFAKIIGVHIRKGDYRQWADGRYFFRDAEWADFLQEYSARFGLSPQNTKFFIFSDESVDLSVFKGLAVAYVHNAVAAADLFALAMTDTVIGTNSTFAAFASYYGNVPLIVMEKTMDWDYYKDKKEYFENKYCPAGFLKGDNLGASL